MKVLNIKIQGQTAVWENPFEIVSGSQKYLYIKPIFDSSWDGLDVKFLFRDRNGNEIWNSETNTAESEGTKGLVRIPADIMTAPYFLVGVLGYGADDKFIPTASLKIDVDDDGYDAFSKINGVSQEGKESLEELILSDFKAVMDSYAQTMAGYDEKMLEYASAEEARQKAEESRVADETSRKNAETGREKQEETRQANEETREESEKLRQTFEDERQYAESNRLAAEESRVFNEEQRTFNEAERQNTESFRGDSEYRREEQEKTRQVNEEDRMANETIRQVQEEVRVKAEKERDEKWGNVSNAVKETVTGISIVLKDISPLVDSLKVKVTGEYTPETKVLKEGQNVWDEELADNLGGGGRVYSKHYIRVFPGEKYYLYCNSPVYFWEKVNLSDELGMPLFATIEFYDTDYQLLTDKSDVVRNSEITIPTGCKYIKFALNESYGLTYKNDICINISDERINGTYAPYGKTEYSIDDYGNAVITAPIYRVTTLSTDADNVTLECEYNKDINAVIDNIKPLELLYDGTTTEEVSTISVTKDLLGNIFELKELYAVVEMPNPKDINPYFYLNSLASTNSMPYGAVGNNNSTFIFTWALDKPRGKVEQYQYYTVSKTSKVFERNIETPVIEFKMKTFKKENVQQFFPIGTRVKVWGKRV